MVPLEFFSDIILPVALWLWGRLSLTETSTGCLSWGWNEEVLFRVNEQRNILHEIRKRKANWIGRISRRNCLLKQVIEGKIKGEMEVTRIWGRIHKKLLHDLNDRRGYCHLKEEALDRAMWRNRLEEALNLSSDRILNEWVKGSRCVRLTTLPPSCVVVMKSWNLNFVEPSGPLQACNGTALHLPSHAIVSFKIYISWKYSRTAGHEEGLNFLEYLRNLNS
jgi:hypothetical protein